MIAIQNKYEYTLGIISGLEQAFALVKKHITAEVGEPLIKLIKEYEDLLKGESR